MKYLYIFPVIIIVAVTTMIFKNMKIPADLGVIDGKLAKVPDSPNAVSSQVDDAEKKVMPFIFKESLGETKESVKKCLLAYGRIEIIREEANYIHAVSTTALMHYHDDIEFYFDEDSGLVHFRSASRVGRSDMGMNRNRYNRLVELYN